MLVVRDRGMGVPEADRERIFEPFYRASNVVTKISGAGVGLAGVRRIVEQMGGSISLHSREGEESEFTVRLPLTAASAV